jgi:hypothetical protein
MHFNVTKRLIRKCVKIGACLKLHVHEEGDVGGTACAQVVLYEGHAPKGLLIRNTCANQIHSKPSSSHDLSIHHIKVWHGLNPRYKLTAGGLSTLVTSQALITPDYVKFHTDLCPVSSCLILTLPIIARSALGEAVQSHHPCYTENR